MSLRFENMIIPSADFHGVSSLPPLAAMSNVQNMTAGALDEDDELYVGYGFLQSIFPYRMQDLYDRTLTPREYTAAVLENEYLRAVFLPQLGGRLWSLYDKKAGRDLLYANTVVRPCNLALRNAWFSGGIEFNCGMVGHSPFTCDPLFMAQTTLDDGTPVLRFYEYERIRACVYQMDFFLPEGSPVLYGRMRIVNPNRETVPMYWWSNIAVPEEKGYRMIVPAHAAFTNKNFVVGKVQAPLHQGRDITYPTNNLIAVDYFWKIPPEKRKFMAYFDPNGYGFFQTSTNRQRGRKMFVWGQGPGGARWQEFLTEDGSTRRYAEIQAGVGQTQYECIPMPPKTAWEWVECYGAVSMDPATVNGDWDTAIEQTAVAIEERISQDTLNRLLADTHTMATSPATTVFYGSGWGKLEQLRREAQGDDPLCPHLDFGRLQDEQQPWYALLKQGNLLQQDACSFPVSWMMQKEWTALLEAAPDSHEKHLHLAAIYAAQGQLEAAETAARAAVAFSRSAAALFVLAQTLRMKGDPQACAATLLEAQRLCPDDIPMARETLRAALQVNDLQAVIHTYETLPTAVTQDGRVSMLYALALLRQGDIDAAEAVLYRDGGLVVEDIRESEESLTELYLNIQCEKAKKTGQAFDPATATVPKQFDFRMFVE